MRTQMTLAWAIVAALAAGSGTELAPAQDARFAPHPTLTEARAMPPATPSRRPARVTVSGEHVTRSIDCGGGDVLVTANSADLTLNNCAGVTVSGSKDHVTAHLAPAGEIIVLGNDDVVRWQAAEGYPVEVKDQGQRNNDAPL